MIPLVTEQEVFFQRSKKHAEDLDQQFGFRIAQVEQEVAKEKNLGTLADKETWNHLSPQIFQTPYIELRFILESLLNLKDSLGIPEPCRIVDLGAAYFRLAFVTRLLFNNQFLAEGYEICPQRVTEAKRVYELYFGEPLVHLHAIDVSAVGFEIPLADVYFIYDFGTTSDIEHLLKNLLQPSKSFLLVARGARINSLLLKNYSNALHEHTRNQNYSLWVFPIRSQL
jgi:hypothetical protein